jgi:hypothetical protein
MYDMIAFLYPPMMQMNYVAQLVEAAGPVPNAMSAEDIIHETHVQIKVMMLKVEDHRRANADPVQQRLPDDINNVMRNEHIDEMQALFGEALNRGVLGGVGDIVGPPLLDAIDAVDLEFEAYKVEALLPASQRLTYTDILPFWKHKDRMMKYPNLYIVQRGLHGKPFASSKLEQYFSYVPMYISSRRAHLGPALADASMFLAANYALIPSFNQIPCFTVDNYALHLPQLKTGDLAVDKPVHHEYGEDVEGDYTD